MIEVIEDFITDDELDQFQEIVKSGRWHWGQRSNNNTMFPMWYQPYYGKGAWEDWVPRTVKEVAYRFVNSLPRGSQLQRAMLSGNTFGQDGDIHRDWQDAGCKTMVLFVNKTWNIRWEGETVIYTPELDVLQTVLPIPKRAVAFDSNLPHIGKDPARRCGELRTILAIQAKLP